MHESVIAEPVQAPDPAAPRLLSARQPYDKILRDTDRNHWLNAEEAVAYGLVSRVVEKGFDSF
jgi:hypothetical protein